MIVRAPQSSTLLGPSANALSFLAPALTNSIYLAIVLQRVLSTTTIFLLFRTYLLSGLLLRQSFYASEILLVQSYYASALIAKQLFLASKRSFRLTWRATDPLRKKLFFEFMTFVLGSGGNNIILLMFWPGWLVLGSGIWCVMWACG